MKKGKKNLIFIVIDALRAQNLSCYGYPQKTSPFIDSLAKKGLLFENFYSSTDQTDPAFTSIFSGRYPITNGIIFHGNDITPEQKNDLKKTNTKFLAELLKKNDNEMVTIGIDWLSRWHKRGFEIYGEDEILPAKKGIFHKYKWINEKVKKIINQFSLEWYYLFNDFLEPYGFKCRGDAEGYFNYARFALKKYASNKNFFLLMHFWDVHSPWHYLPVGYIKKFDTGNRRSPVKDSLNKYKNKKWRDTVQKYHLAGIKYLSEVEIRYNAAINYLDTELAKFIDFLKKEGVWQDTHLIITGDHGDNLVMNDLYISHGGNSNRIMKVPLIMVGPNLPHKRIQEMSHHVDILPTILDLFEISSDYKSDGSSLLPLINGEEVTWRNEIFFISSGAKKRYTLLNERFKYNYSPTKEDSKDKIGNFWYPERVELFDLKKDKDEQKNIVKEKPMLAKLMEKRLNQILKNLRLKKEKYITDYTLLKLKPSLLKRK